MSMTMSTAAPAQKRRKRIMQTSSGGSSVRDVETRRKRVLCVDDDLDLVRMLELRLKAFDIDVVSAYFGMQGFWAAINERPDLILLDLAMPQGDGRQVIELLRNNQQTHHIPTIVLTGMRDRRLPSQLFALGADQFLRKPIRFDELIHEISRFIDLETVHDPSSKDGFQS